MEHWLSLTGVGPELTTENILQSISAALHISSSPVVGQGNNRATVAKNPGVNIDVYQPHIQVGQTHIEVWYRVGFNIYSQNMGLYNNVKE